MNTGKIIKDTYSITHNPPCIQKKIYLEHSLGTRPNNKIFSRFCPPNGSERSYITVKNILLKLKVHLSTLQTSKTSSKGFVREYQNITMCFRKGCLFLLRTVAISVTYAWREGKYSQASTQVLSKCSFNIRCFHHLCFSFKLELCLELNDNYWNNCPADGAGLKSDEKCVCSQE